MQLEKKKVQKYGSSKIVRLPNYKIDDEVYVLDKEMVEHLTNKNKNGK